MVISGRSYELAISKKTASRSTIKVAAWVKLSPIHFCLA
jgi:hypothetical protein